jgi:hypothetical protein
MDIPGVANNIRLHLRSAGSGASEAGPASCVASGLGCYDTSFVVVSCQGRRTKRQLVGQQIEGGGEAGRKSSKVVKSSNCVMYQARPRQLCMRHSGSVHTRRRI